jgi:hypothetical protein
VQATLCAHLLTLRAHTVILGSSPSRRKSRQKSLACVCFLSFYTVSDAFQTADKSGVTETSVHQGKAPWDLIGDFADYGLRIMKGALKWIGGNVVDRWVNLANREITHDFSVCVALCTSPAHLQTFSAHVVLLALDGLRILARLNTACPLSAFNMASLCFARDQHGSSRSAEAREGAAGGQARWMDDKDSGSCLLCDQVSHHVLIERIYSHLNKLSRASTTTQPGCCTSY